MWPQSSFTPAVRILQSLVQALKLWRRGFLWYKPDKHAVFQKDLFTFLQLLATVTYVDSAPTDGMYACLSPQLNKVRGPCNKGGDHRSTAIERTEGEV